MTEMRCWCFRCSVPRAPTAAPVGDDGRWTCGTCHAYNSTANKVTWWREVGDVGVFVSPAYGNYQEPWGYTVALVLKDKAFGRGAYYTTSESAIEDAKRLLDVIETAVPKAVLEAGRAVLDKLRVASLG